jgi:hypothetical protein
VSDELAEVQFADGCHDAPSGVFGEHGKADK